MFWWSLCWRAQFGSGFWGFDCGCIHCIGICVCNVVIVVLAVAFSGVLICCFDPAGKLGCFVGCASDFACNCVVGCGSSVSRTVHSPRSNDQLDS